MKHITIKRAEQADVDAIMQLMQEAVDTVKVSDWFLPDNRQYIEEHISDRGFTLKALSSNNEILGFFIADLPGLSLIHIFLTHHAVSIIFFLLEEFRHIFDINRDHMVRNDVFCKVKPEFGHLC